MRRASPSATSLECNGLKISVASGEARRYKSPRMDEGEGGSPRRNGRHRMKWGKGRDIASGRPSGAAKQRYRDYPPFVSKVARLKGSGPHGLMGCVSRPGQHVGWLKTLSGTTCVLHSLGNEVPLLHALDSLACMYPWPEMIGMV